MEEAINKLQDLLSRLEAIKSFDSEVLIDIKNKLNLYIQKFFGSRNEYLDILKKINTNPGSTNSFSLSVAEFKSLITTLIQDIELSKKDHDLLDQKEKMKINQIRREIEQEQVRIQNDAQEIRIKKRKR